MLDLLQNLANCTVANCCPHSILASLMMFCSVVSHVGAEGGWPLFLSPVQSNDVGRVGCGGLFRTASRSWCCVRFVPSCSPTWLESTLVVAVKVHGHQLHTP